MKPSQHITLLFTATIFLTSSCNTSRDQAIRNYYSDVNKYTVIENRLLSNNNLIDQDKPSKTKSLHAAYNQSSEQTYQDKVHLKSEEYKILYDDSEIANGDVYREAAAHRKKLMSRISQNCNCDTVTSKNTSSKATNKKQTPEIFVHLLDTDNKPMQKVGIAFLEDNDKDRMKQYSVIIASLARPESMERLKEAFANSNDRLLFVKNEMGFHYAIIGSYDTFREAEQKLKRVRSEFNSLYTAEQLRNKYGIPFTDLWILKK